MAVARALKTKSLAQGGASQQRTKNKERLRPIYGDSYQRTSTGHLISRELQTNSFGSIVGGVLEVFAGMSIMRHLLRYDMREIRSDVKSYEASIRVK